jgi:hypothetical protein
MSREIQLGADTGESIAAEHDKASTLIEDTAEAMPAGVDGGEASELLARILAGVATTASSLADVNLASALVVRDVDGSFGETESEVATVFRDMTKEIR